MIQLATAVVMLAAMILAFVAGFIIGVTGTKKSYEEKEEKSHEPRHSWD